MPAAKPKGQTLTLDYVAKHFSDEDAAYQFVEHLRWPVGPVCPHCGGTKAYFLQPRTPDRYTRTGHATQRRVYKCAACRKQFSVLIGTIFEDSRIPLGKWLLGIYMMCSGKNGVSAHELHRDLEITYKSAWFMAHRIREAMKRPPLVAKLGEIVEVDETYIGGKAKNMQKADRERRITGRGGVGKTPVVALVERGGDVRYQVMKHVTGNHMRQALCEQVDCQATLMTDESHVYPPAGQSLASHQAVDHGAGEYVRGNAHINTANTVEGYFSQLKRSVDGTHHHVSEHHLPRYLAEFDFRYNTRKMEDGERTERAIKQTEGKRRRYHQPVGRP